MHITIDSIRNALEDRSAVEASVAGALEAAVALTMAPDAGGRLSILLIKRAERAGDPWSGQMALPGGRRDRVDATLEETARRETLEETGVDLLRGVRLGVLDDLRPQSRHLPPLVVRPYVFALTDRPPITASDEVA
ncbi:MAG TPA: NUDIX domain-containing protein, partial [Gemmatimonadales bacterium]|nr:NUDIX domain-containing protein [Gemmatimonadales bacterium]